MPFHGHLGFRIRADSWAQASDGKDAQLCTATSHDLIQWQRRGVIMPAHRGNWNAGWTKPGAVVPKKIGGKYGAADEHIAAAAPHT
jgi:hypothetical protein